MMDFLAGGEDIGGWLGATRCKCQKSPHLNVGLVRCGGHPQLNVLVQKGHHTWMLAANSGGDLCPNVLVWKGSHTWMFDTSSFEDPCLNIGY